jgi:hypothetical protein
VILGNSVAGHRRKADAYGAGSEVGGYGIEDSGQPDQIHLKDPTARSHGSGQSGRNNKRVQISKFGNSGHQSADILRIRDVAAHCFDVTTDVLCDGLNAVKVDVSDNQVTTLSEGVRDRRSHTRTCTDHNVGHLESPVNCVPKRQFGSGVEPL